MFLLLVSFLRTIVPAIVGAVVGYLVSLGLEVDPEFQGALTAVLFALFTGLYYLIIRVIEMKFPNIGILLGFNRSPDSYSKGSGVDIVAKDETQVVVNSDAKVIAGTTLPNLNSSVVGLDRVPGPDHRADVEPN